MRMILFGQHSFQELCQRHLVVFQIKRLPVHHYGLLEYYCAEPDCDCRRVVLDVVSVEHFGRIFASIHFGWDSLAYYRKLAKDRGMDACDASPLRKGMLNPANLDCDWANVLLRHIRKEVLSDPKAVARFRRHYELVKREERRRWRE